jgi:hypothetical protein
VDDLAKVRSWNFSAFGDLSDEQGLAVAAGKIPQSLYGISCALAEHLDLQKGMKKRSR